jgi:hypothetical protein
MTRADDRWNPLRLVDTLTFFGEIPLVGNIRWLQQMFGAPSNPVAPSRDRLRPDLSLVLLSDTGAAAIAQRLLIPETSLRGASGLGQGGWVNAAALVWWGTPQDETQLANQVAALKVSSASEAVVLFDFQTWDAATLQVVWGAVDDVVMGGVSASGMGLLPGFARFSGTVSAANSGGFASVRSRNFEPAYDLSDWQGIRLDLRGDGQRYKVILRNSSNWDSLAYCASITTEADAWMRVDVPFSAFRPTFRAKSQSIAPPLAPASICSFQLMLSKFEYDGMLNPEFRPGDFSLDLRAIAAYRLVSLPRLIALAPSAEAATTYQAMLTNSGLAHQVFTTQDEQAWKALLLSALGQR